MKKKISWQVTEDAGVVTLMVMKNEKLVFAHAGYEREPKQLISDIEWLSKSDPSDWDDGNDLYELDNEGNVIAVAYEKPSNSNVIAVG